MIKLTADIDPKVFYRKIEQFGFLETTGIELAGETKGSLPEPKKWSGLTKPNLVIGQGVGVNMMQLAMAYASVANGGWLLKPTLVRELRYPGGDVEKVNPIQVHRVMGSETAALLSEILTDAVASGTGKNARIEGMKVAGKTGTAQIVDHAKGRYLSDRYFTSFVGFFPAESPRYLVLVAMMDPSGPRGEHSGGGVCAPIFKRVAERIIGYKPELWAIENGDDERLNDDQVVVPDLIACEYDQAEELLNKRGLRAVKQGRGVIHDQVPAPGTIAMKGDKVLLTLGPGSLKRGATIMPALTGLSLRDAVKKATESGLMVQIRGSGRVVRQAPGSGEKITVGALCTIQAEG